MEKQEPNYGLRPRRSSTKGKYLEMLGISNQYPENSAESRMESMKPISESTADSVNKGCKVFLLPLVVSGESDILADNTIEIEISEDVSVSDLTDAHTVNEELKPSKATEYPLRHIDEILQKNHQLIESIPEGPSFKKRGKAIKEEPSAEITDSGTVQHANKTVRSKTVGSNKILTRIQFETTNNEVSLNLNSIKHMMQRPLAIEEEEKIEELLKAGRPDKVVELLFGSEAENRIRKCFNCQALIKGSDLDFASHYVEVHDCDPVFVCELCDEITMDSSLYQNHLESHFKSDGLKQSNSIRGDSSEETEGKEMTGEPFVCDICGKTLKHQKSLYSHRRTHTDAKAVCHICGATLKSSRYLHHHLLLHKDVEKPHKCDKCGKAFFSSSALKVHHYYNHEEHPGRFQCSVCGKNFKAKQGLQFHMDSHSNELRYECSYCHKRFRGFKTCRVHELRHREANEPNKFSCSICGKQFKTRQTLKNHEDVHASFNRYQCSLCEKRFKLRKSCLAHIRVHHTDHERAETQQTIVPDEGEVAIESLLADGEEYVVTLEDGTEGETVLLEQDGNEQTIEVIVPDAHVECEIANAS